LFGSLTFSNTYTGFTYGDFLLGIPATTSRSYPPLETQLLRWGYDIYVTDSFKVAPALTLDLGLRYELHPLYHQQNDLLSVFDIGHARSWYPIAPSPKSAPCCLRTTSR
jgi:outer membrane receptor protein involved in Fe transport